MEITVEQLIDFRFDSNISKAASFFKVSISTIYRWIQDNHLPAHAQDKVMLFNRALNELSDDWKGWRICPDGLQSSNGVFLHVDQLTAYADWLQAERKTFNVKAAEYMRTRNCKYRRWQYLRANKIQ